MDATRHASEKRREQNRNAQRVFRDKKKRELEERDQELSTAKRRLQELATAKQCDDAERERLRQQLRMYEPHNPEPGSPITINLTTSSADGEELKRVVYDDPSIYATPAAPMQSMPVFEPLPEDIRSSWSRPGTEEAELDKPPACQTLVPPPSASPVHFGPRNGDQAGSQGLSNFVPKDILSCALSEWEKSEQYGIKSAEQYDKAAKQAAQKAQSLFQLYTSMNAPIWGNGAGYKTDADLWSHSYPITTPSWAGNTLMASDQQSNKYLLNLFDENINILDPQLSLHLL